MDALAKKRLEERILEEVQTMLSEGDRSYLSGLSHTALREAVETELQFLGLYSHDDQETPAVIHRILEKYLEQWSDTYLRQPKVHLENSPFQQFTSSGKVGITWDEPTQYVHFFCERPPIEVGPI